MGLVPGVHSTALRDIVGLWARSWSKILWKTKNVLYPLHHNHHNSFGPCFPGKRSTGRGVNMSFQRLETQIFWSGKLAVPNFWLKNLLSLTCFSLLSIKIYSRIQCQYDNMFWFYYIFLWVVSHYVYDVGNSHSKLTSFPELWERGELSCPRVRIRI